LTKEELAGKNQILTLLQDNLAALAVKNQVLALLQENSIIDYTAILQDADRLRMDNASNVIGER
jgi:hypothetical protein